MNSSRCSSFDTLIFTCSSLPVLFPSFIFYYTNIEKETPWTQKCNISAPGLAFPSNRQVPTEVQATGPFLNMRLNCCACIMRVPWLTLELTQFLHRICTDLQRVLCTWGTSSPHALPSWSPDDPRWYFSTLVRKDLFIVVAISFNQKIRAVASYFFSTANIHQLNPLVWKYQSPLFSWGFVWITLSAATKSCCFSLAWETMLSSRKYKQYIVRSWVKASQGEWEILMRPNSYQNKGLCLFCEVALLKYSTDKSFLLPFTKSTSASSVYTAIPASPHS